MPIRSAAAPARQRRHCSIHQRTGWLSAAGAAAMLAAVSPAAAGDDGYGQLIVFGDSISDSGSYAALAPAGAGRFTTNPDAVWVELVAAGVGLDLASHAAGGTNYAEGGARVSTPRPGGPGGLTRTPVSEQIDRRLAAEPAFSSDSLVIVQGGGNDVFFTQSNGVDFTEADLRVLDTAANDLAEQLQRLHAAGAQTIVTTSVPRFEVFNSRYEAAITAAGVNVLYVDVAGLIAEIEASPQDYGLVNITDPACRGRFVQSFDCLPEDYVAPDANRTYLFADGVHFTGVVHEMQAELVLAALRAPQMISQLPYVAQADARAQAAVLSRRFSAVSPPAGGWQVFGRVEADEFETDGASHRPGLDAGGGRLTFGADYGLGETASVGAVLSLGEGDGDFGDQYGRFDLRSVGAGVFARRAIGPIEAQISAAYHKANFDDVTRIVSIGVTPREEVGDTDAKVLSLAAEAQGDVIRGPLRVRPLAGLRYEKVRLDGYAEAGERSSRMVFEAQTVETLTVALGAELSVDAGEGLRPYLRATYEVDVLDQDHRITVTPQGAPVPFTTAAYQPGADYLAYDVGLEADLGPRAVAIAGVRGVTANSELSTTAGFVGVRLAF